VGDHHHRHRSSRERNVFAEDLADLGVGESPVLALGEHAQRRQASQKSMHPSEVDARRDADLLRGHGTSGEHLGDLQLGGGAHELRRAEAAHEVERAI
jgi:hypothetical protein